MGTDTLEYLPDEPGFIAELREISCYLWHEGHQSLSEKLDEIINEIVLDKSINT